MAAVNSKKGGAFIEEKSLCLDSGSFACNG